jgi:hypothetical protein
LGFIVIPVLLAALLTSIIRRKEVDRQRKDAASNALRASFNPTIAQLDLARKHKSTHDAPDIDGQLVAVLHIQAEAIEGYRFFVPENNKDAYQKAWNDYYETAKGGTFVESFIGNNDPLAFIEQKIHNIINLVADRDHSKSITIRKVSLFWLRHWQFIISTIIGLSSIIVGILSYIK